MNNISRKLSDSDLATLFNLMKVEKGSEHIYLRAICPADVPGGNFFADVLR